MSMKSVPARAPRGDAARTEQRVLDLRRVGNAGHDDLARAGDAGRIAGIDGAGAP